jgi:hypothetical protein
MTPAFSAGLNERRMWLAFGAVIVVNIVWLLMALRSPDHVAADVSAYGECRSAIRQARSDAKTGVFPTLDLIRVSHDADKSVVRGYFETHARTKSAWYSCGVVRLSDAGWRVVSLAFDSERSSSQPRGQ